MALIFGAGDGALEDPAAAEDEGARQEVDGKGGGARKDGAAAEADEGETKAMQAAPSAEVPLAESPVERCRQQPPWVETPPGPASPTAKDW